MKTKPDDYAHPYERNLRAQSGLHQPGPTKREHFAAMAMQGLLSDRDNIHWHGYLNIPEEAVKMADALISELNKPIKSKETPINLDQDPSDSRN